MKEPAVDLVVDIYELEEHAVKLMKRLGITYKLAVPQSLGDQWWFFNCRNVPPELPSCVTTRDFGNLDRLVGYGLSKENVTAIYADRGHILLS